MHRSLALALVLLTGCPALYSTNVTPAAGAPHLSPAARAEVVHTRPSAGRELATIAVQGNGNASDADCEAKAAREAAELGATVVFVTVEASHAALGAGPHCTGVAFAP